MKKEHRSKASHFCVAAAQTAKSMLRDFVRTKVGIRTIDKHIGVRGLRSVRKIAVSGSSLRQAAFLKASIIARDS
jgi:hypothetical protein